MQTEPVQSQRVERWWIVFSDGDPRGQRWWHLFTRPGFRHCFAFSQPYDDVILLVNPLESRIEAVPSKGWAWEWIADYMAKGVRIVVIERKNSDKDLRFRVMKPRVVLTCASVLAYLVGLDAWVVTPQGLYRELLRRGGRELCLHSSAVHQSRT